MKLVKIVKYQRVRYVDLEEDDLLTTEHLLSEGRRLPKRFTAEEDWSEHSPVVLACDTDKYPPGVTYNIEGMTAEGEDPDVYVDSLGGVVLLGLFHFDESEIETRYI